MISPGKSYFIFIGSTGGFALHKKTLDDIEKAYKKRGIIILTDPDSAGERIRKFLAKRFPEAKHAFVPVEDATANNDIGIEQAKPDAIRAALAKVRTHHIEPTNVFTGADLIRAGISGDAGASSRRAKLGAALGNGVQNALVSVFSLLVGVLCTQSYIQAIFARHSVAFFARR